MFVWTNYNLFKQIVTNNFFHVSPGLRTCAQSAQTFEEKQQQQQQMNKYEPRTHWLHDSIILFKFFISYSQVIEEKQQKLSSLRNFPGSGKVEESQLHYSRCA